LCFHSWWSEDIPNSEFERIAGLAQAWDKEVWCNELGFDAMAWRQRGMNATYDYALRFAKISHRMLKYAKVAVSQYWTWQNNYSIMSADTETKYPSYFITKHQVDYLNSGTQIVHSASSDPDVFAIAGIHPDGKKVIQVINTKNKTVEIGIEGFGNLKKIVSTTENNLWEEKPAKKQIITLDAESVNTLIF
jgi:hypothetical protein